MSEQWKYESPIRPSLEAIKEEIRFVNESRPKLLDMRNMRNKRRPLSAVKPPRDIEMLEDVGVTPLAGAAPEGEGVR